jgi:hypothetical protein
MWMFYTGASPILRLALLFLLCGGLVGGIVVLTLWLRKL